MVKVNRKGYYFIPGTEELYYVNQDFQRANQYKDLKDAGLEISEVNDGEENSF
tara:strand:+ start:652 stop:810 length:159 start_codon:yes stop_codon:yes gene_type:complete